MLNHSLANFSITEISSRILSARHNSIIGPVNFYYIAHVTSFFKPVLAGPKCYFLSQRRCYTVQFRIQVLRMLPEGGQPTASERA
jgi:hypothetical protein